jgi:hypothetical protein
MTYSLIPDQLRGDLKQVIEGDAHIDLKVKKVYSLILDVVSKTLAQGRPSDTEQETLIKQLQGHIAELNYEGRVITAAYESLIDRLISRLAEALNN